MVKKYIIQNKIYITNIINKILIKMKKFMFIMMMLLGFVATSSSVYA